jgi:signal transduction histidine kinase
VLCAAIYRIVQEAMTNALRHGEPSEVAIALMRCEGGLNVVVTDNGRGCEPGALKQGLGIAGIRERVAALGGTVAFAARAEGGLSVSAHFPLQTAS